MTFGAKKSDVCSDKERDEFLSKVKDYLIINNLTCKKIRAFNSFGGTVRIYTGKMEKIIPLRARRKLVAFRNPDGKIEGENLEACEELKKSNVTYLYEKHYEPFVRPEYFDVYRVDEWNEEEKYLIEKLTK